MTNIHSQPIYKNYLLSTKSSRTFSIYDSLHSFYNKHPLGKPFFSRIEFRTQTDEFRIDQQEYTLRLRTSNPLNNKYQNKINQVEQEELRLTKGARLAENLYRKYKVIGKYESLILKIQNLKEQKLLYGKLVSYYKDLIVLPGKNNIENLYEYSLKLSKADSELADDEFELNLLQSEIFSDSVPSVNLPIPLDIKSIQHFVNHYTPVIEPIESSALNLDLLKSELELKQKRSNDNKLLDHIQIQYQSDPKDLIQKKLSLGLGLRIPYLIANTYQKEEFQIKSFNTRIEKAEQEEKLAVRIKSIVSKIDRIDHAIDNLQAQRSSISRLFNTDSLVNLGFADAKLILEIKLQENRMSQNILELHSDAIEFFIDFLYYTDHFYNQPDTYYLTIPFQKL